MTWQESARKDLKRSFRILKSQWKFVKNKIHLLELKNFIEDELVPHPAQYEVEEEMEIEGHIFDEEAEKSKEYCQFRPSNEHIMKVLIRINVC